MFLCIAILVTLVNFGHCEDVKVKVDHGTIIGQTQVVDGVSVDVFLSIPYAKAPVGELRFKNPIPNEESKGEFLNSLKKPAACYQILPPENVAMFKTPAEESEDCLFLNIHVPKVDTKEPLPVVIYIHGGGFYQGCMSQDCMFRYDPTPLAAVGKIIVVTIQYRLGVFGFMAAHDDEIPGNAGLFDQVMAIQWVKKHISSFGGNPDEITLQGNTVGATSVTFHMLSPLSQNLFKRVILESGSALSFGMTAGFDNGPINLEKVAEKLKCPFTPRGPSDKYAKFSKETYDCMKKATPKELLLIQTENAKSGRSAGFVPVVDGKFLPEHPMKLLRAMKWGPQRDVLIGTNLNDGALFLSLLAIELFPIDKEQPKDLTRTKIITECMSRVPEESRPKFAPYTDVLFDFLFTGVKDDDGPGLTAALAGGTKGTLFLCPAIDMVESMLNLSDSNIFFYEFYPRPSREKLYPWAKGALCTEELEFVFGNPVLSPKEYTEAEVKLSKEIMADWAHFIKHGKPPAERKWTPCQSDSKSHLVYDINKIELKEGYPKNRCDQYFDNLIEQVINNLGYFV